MDQDLIHTTLNPRTITLSISNFSVITTRSASNPAEIFPFRSRAPTIRVCHQPCAGLIPSPAVNARSVRVTSRGSVPYIAAVSFSARLIPAARATALATAAELQ